MITTPHLEEQHPHLYKKISLKWGSRECRDLLLQLLNDTRDGKRMGFAPEVGSEIIKLVNEHDTEFPAFDVSHKIDIPFSSSRPPRVVSSSHNDGVVIGVIAKAIVLVLILSILFKVFK